MLWKETYFSWKKLNKLKYDNNIRIICRLIMKLFPIIYVSKGTDPVTMILIEGYAIPDTVR